MLCKTRFCELCLSGLLRMYSAETGLFSFSYRPGPVGMTNVPLPNPQFKYTMNTLMGLHKAGLSGYQLFCDPIRDCIRVVASWQAMLADPENSAGALWAMTTMGIEPPSVVVESTARMLKAAARRPVTAQALAWSILACTAPGSPLHTELPGLLDLALRCYVHPRTSLVRHLPAGYRRSMASFAASCYMAYAFLEVANALRDQRALEAGVRMARALVALQAPQGQWAWFYNVPRGIVVDYYPVYSVHQHSMAPMFLLRALDLGYEEFREPLLKGFRWILRTNEAGGRMVDPERRLVWRSVEGGGAFGRLGRALSALWPVGQTQATVDDGRRLHVNTECRSYELGWGLWAFAGRADFAEILDDGAFALPPTP